ncbi:33406_t:CDS:1, partial [Racocetra persica]
MEEEGFKNDVNITLTFLSSTNLFETYASSCFDGCGKLLLKAFTKVIK